MKRGIVMNIRFDFKRECYCIDLRRAIIFSAALVGAWALVCFFIGEMQIYSLLLLPRFAMRLSICSVFWIVGFVFIGFALEIILSSCRGKDRKKINAITSLVLTAIVGYMWFPLFFGLNAFFLAFVACVLTCALAFVTFKRLLCLCPPSAFLIGLHFLWCVYFAVVNFCIFILN